MPLYYYADYTEDLLRSSLTLAEVFSLTSNYISLIGIQSIESWLEELGLSLSTVFHRYSKKIICLPIFYSGQRSFGYKIFVFLNKQLQKKPFGI